MRAVVAAVAWLLGVGGVLFTAFVLGFRSKFPPLHDAIRRFNRDVTNPRQLQRAGQPGARASVIQHVGRTSGTAYRTPVVAVSTADGFVFALPYGPTADWVRNVLAAESATIEHEGQHIQAQQPELLSGEQAAGYFPSGGQWMHRIYGVEDALLLHRRGMVEAHDAPP